MSMTLEEARQELTRAAKRIAQAREYVHIDVVRTEIARLEEKSGEQGFWDDPDSARQHMKKIKALRDRVEPWEVIEGEVSDLIELSEMAEDDPDMEGEILTQAPEIGQRLDRLESLALMTGDEDKCDGYLHIHAGAGGTESCDWASMLLRMYTRWCEQNDMSCECVDLQDGDEAGIRAATLLIKGSFAYGQLKCECGIHRLVRISPFDANKRRHTSFTSIYVWPDIDDSVEIDIRDEDLRIDTFRASGAGGQHVNKTESAIRITHIPSNIIVSCQNERSQHQNKAVAMKMLRSRLYQYERERKDAEIASKSAEKKDIGWGSQIRSYVFQPYQMVKDLRTGCQTSGIQNVMDGDLNPFVEAYLRWAASGADPVGGNAE